MKPVVDETTTTLKGWEDFWTQGQTYAALAKKAQYRKEKFNPDLLYNISAMAIENLVVGFLALRGSMPENHALRDLVRALENNIDLHKELKQRILFMDRFQEICSLLHYGRKIPSWEDVAEFVDLVETLEMNLIQIEPKHLHKLA